MLWDNWHFKYSSMARMLKGGGRKRGRHVPHSDGFRFLEKTAQPSCAAASLLVSSTLKCREGTKRPKEEERQTHLDDGCTFCNDDAAIHAYL